MNIPISWLKALTPIQDTAKQFSEKITNIGLAVEGITQPDAEITGIVIGKITSLEKHPDADKLWVTKTDIGTEVLQIITGADNLKLGDTIPVAVNGSTLANGLKIKKTKMRGLESNGMLVSVEELGYTREDYPEAPEDGIYVFPEPHNLPLGADAKPYLGLADEVLEFDILSNRPDTNAVIGVAREAAALYNQPFIAPEILVKEEAPGQALDYVTVDIRDPKRCPRYIARIITDVRIGPSPKWMRRRLIMSGLRPINNIVDITNYVMLEYGQPLHAFDITAVANKDGKHGVVVRTAMPGEKFTTLDGVERQLSPTTLLIADHEKPIGIAGIMGGENSRITDDTKMILFESANFDSANIRLSARQLGMRTDASARYEKGLDPNMAIICANRAMELVEELGCGKVVPGMVDAYPQERAPKTFTFTPSKISRILGLSEDELPTSEICAYLNRVGIETTAGYEAIIPTSRADITAEADLAEEVGRFYGLNRIPSRYVQIVDGEQTRKPVTRGPARRLVSQVRQAAVALGYYEAKTFPFESTKVYDKLLLPQGHDDRNAMVIKNPLGEDMSIMRTLTLNGLLESLSRNFNNSNQAAYLFEVSKTYHANKDDPAGLSYEPLFLTMAAYGADMGFLSLKGDIEELLATLNIKNIGFARHQYPYTHPGYTALIQTLPKNQDPAPIGYLAQLHPQVCENYNIGTNVHIAVLCLEALDDLAAPRASFTAPSVFPALTRDLALVVPESITSADVETAIRERGGQLLTEIRLFDVYTGPQIEAGHKSMAYNLVFRAKDRTLTDKEVQKPLRGIVDNLQKKLSAQVRDK
ncbi:MAG: phenylalanine--tRNA ligase subunit beta [Defluviitaleaceae bacterium]|nr:phenylalanine--tRNA ligase subunit beta [Defluviitaleaceae bacterium]